MTNHLYYGDNLQILPAHQGRDRRSAKALGGTVGKRLPVVQVAKMFERDASRPGNVALQAGLLIYILAMVLSAAAANTGASTAMAAFRSLVFVPIDTMIGAVLLAPVALLVFLIGLIFGVPYLSFTYCYSGMRRYWRGLVGALLLASVVIAGASAVIAASQ
jgi:hypothetical protein